MNNPFLSVIVPVYNLEDKVDKCISSLVEQDFESFEVILINDGSTDRSEDVLKSYSEKYSNVKYLNQLNSGVSVARNHGIKLASGKYILFVDGDDWVKQGYFQYLFETLSGTNYDALILNYFVYKENIDLQFKVKKAYEHGQVVSGQFFGDLFLSGKLTNSPWDKVFRRDHICKYNDIFPIGISLGEDAVAINTVALDMDKILLSENAYLVYRYNETSLTKSVLTKRKLDDICIAVEKLEKLYTSKYSEEKISYMKVRQLIYYVLNAPSDKLDDHMIINHFMDAVKQTNSNLPESLKWKIMITYLKLLRFVTGDKLCLSITRKLGIKFNL